MSHWNGVDSLFDSPFFGEVHRRLVQNHGTSNQWMSSRPGFNTPHPETALRMPMHPLDGGFRNVSLNSAVESAESEAAIASRLTNVARALAPLVEAEEVAVVSAGAGAMASGLEGAAVAAGPIMAGVAGVLLLIGGGYMLYKHINPEPTTPTEIVSELAVGPGRGFQVMIDRSGGAQYVHRDIHRLCDDLKKL
jgi:hypothetical protein